MARSPNLHQVLAYQAGLSVVVIGVGSVALWAPEPWSWLILALAAGLILIGTVFKPPVGFVVTGAVVVFTGGAYAWQMLFATQVMLPPPGSISIWLGMLFLAGFVPTGLRRSITGVLDAERVMRESFDRLASVDPETGFDSGWRFVAATEAAFRRARRFDETFTVVLIRIMYLDQFQRLYGQQEAQYLIRSVADVLRRRTRICDEKFRVDVDTFALVLPNTAEAGATQLMTKVEQLLGFHDLFEGKRRVKLTVFFGYACSDQGFADHRELIAHAEDELTLYVP